MSEEKNEYANFDQMMRKLIRVPHEKIKAQMEAEKAAKNLKRERRKNGKQPGTK